MSVQLKVTWKGEDLPIDMGRNSLSLEEAIKVEQWSGVPFFSQQPGKPVPMPVWAAQLLVQIRRHDPSATLPEVRALPLSAVVVHTVPDEEPIVGGDGDGGEPDPTDGEGSSPELSPAAASSTSDSSPIS